MHYRDLYEFANGLKGHPVPFESLRERINAFHEGVGKIDVYSVEFPTPNKQAFYWLTGVDRTSAYGDEFLEAKIVYCSELNEHPRERRFALTKELMHVFDRSDQMVNSPDKFRSLVSEIQNRPLRGDESEPYLSEVNTRWMALLVLCPASLREPFLEDYRAGKIAGFDIAEAFGIPEWTAKFVMDPYYDRVLEELINR